MQIPRTIEIYVAAGLTFIFCYNIYKKYYKKRKAEYYFLRYENSLCQQCFLDNKSRCDLQNCAFHVVQMVVGYLDSAKNSLQLCSPSYQSKLLQAAILRANRRQVRIRIITSRAFSLKECCAEGIPIKGQDCTVCQDRHCFLMHNKFIIIDDRVLIRSSLNFAISFLEGNCDNLQVIFDKERILWYQGLFNASWQADIGTHCKESQSGNSLQASRITMSVPSIKLNNGRSMPSFGLGTWMAAPGEVGKAVKIAIDIGYRHIDCALLYQNEQEIGKAIREKIADGTVKREDLFITSKLWQTYHRPDMVIKGIQKSLRNFGLDYLDLYLIHWPFAFKPTDQADAPSKELATAEAIFADEEFMPRDKDGKAILTDEDYVDTWKAMEQCVDLGLAKSIGVSNFNGEQLARILAVAKIPPATNQIEVHPYLLQKPIQDFCNAHNIVVTGYCPLGSGRDYDYVKVLDNPVVKELAAKLEKTPAQLVLRYLVELGVVPIPKSTNPARLQLNISIFDFELTQDQRDKLAALDSNKRCCPVPEAEHHKYYPF